jgi:hypothetical protein
MHEPTKHRFRPGTTLENAQTLLGWSALAVAANAALYLKAPGITGGKAVMDYEAMAEDAAAFAVILDRKAGEMVNLAPNAFHTGAEQLENFENLS